MRIFLDTNILVDTIVERQNKAQTESSRKILLLTMVPQFQLFMSALSIPTISYLLKGVKPGDRKSIIRNLCAHVTVLPTNEEQVKDALDGDFIDIEDGMQNACASENGCDIIVTRNLKDFTKASLPVMDPETFLAVILE